MSTLDTNSLPENVWVEESFYFGNACWPSDATYRRKGDELQIRVELPVKLFKREDGTSFYGSGEKVSDFFRKYVDVEFSVYDGYKAINSPGQRDVPPSLFIVGWKDISNADGWKQYNLDKKDGMR